MHRELVNESAARSNLDYQKIKYRDQPKEADKVLLGLLSDARGSLLDIGCSNGNLLKHLKLRFPDLQLAGGDISEIRIDTCRADPELSGIDFQVMDAMNLIGSYDVIVANAVLCLLNKSDYAKAVKSIYRALRPGGIFVAFDWLHKFDQDLAINEVTDEIPEGVTLYFRSFRTTRHILAMAGFDGIDFLPFDIPIDLPIDHSKAITTHTVPMQDGSRLQFRGAISQPWCHMKARKD